jgi:glutamate-ammonia-ligase adenylyltransferase
MRTRLAAAKPAQGPLDLKNSAGRLQELELFAQMAALRAASPSRRTEQQLLAARRAGVIAPEVETRLATAYRLMWRVHATLRLLGDRLHAPDALSGGATVMLLRETGLGDLDALVREIAAHERAVAEILAAALPAPDAE